MARNEIVSAVADTWTQITNGDATSITFVNQGYRVVRVTALNGVGTPADDDGMEFAPGTGLYNATLSEAFPGVSGANRVYVLSPTTQNIFVSHA